jgi:hypothetical protein
MENYKDNNVIKIGGRVVVEPEFSHELFDEKFYIFYIETKRLSDYNDKLPIIISERLIDISKIKNGVIYQIEGQFRSYNKITDGKSKLVLSIFAKEILQVDDEEYLMLNESTFIGYICKNPIYRKTPLGREIADVLVAVNRSYKKSDYIPCILWGRNAKFCETLPVGTMIKLSGRIQSRTYEKKKEDGTVITKIAYEVSISKFSVVDEKKIEEKEEFEEITD